MPCRKLLIFLPTILLLFACGKPRENAKNVFYWNIGQGYNSMDPAFASTQANIWVVNQLFNGLVELDDSLHIIPAIATRWDISADGLLYTFHLRPEVFFHNDKCFPGGKGRKLTASDFVYSFQRLMDPATAARGKWVFQDKVAENGFIATNDSTLQIKLTKPYRPFLQLLSLKFCSVVPREAIEAYGKDFRAHPVGTGPFYLKYYYEGDE